MRGKPAPKPTHRHNHQMLGSTPLRYVTTRHPRDETTPVGADPQSGQGRPGLNAPEGGFPWVIGVEVRLPPAGPRESIRFRWESLLVVRTVWTVWGESPKVDPKKNLASKRTRGAKEDSDEKRSSWPGSFGESPGGGSSLQMSIPDNKKRNLVCKLGSMTPP